MPTPPFFLVKTRDRVLAVQAPGVIIYLLLALARCYCEYRQFNNDDEVVRLLAIILLSIANCYINCNKIEIHV